MMRNWRRWLLILASISYAAISLNAQNCPPDDSPTAIKQSVLSGTVRFHRELRDWLGLELNSPACGQGVVQLTFLDGDTSLRFRQTMALDGCKVKVTGVIEMPVSSYYSAGLYIADGKIEPEASCRPGPLPPELSAAPVQKDIESYQATVSLDIEKNKPMDVSVRRTDGQDVGLNPWQAYIEAGLNGSRETLWVTCRNGFLAKSATTLVNGREGKSNDRLTAGTLGLATSETGQSSITITCVKDTKKTYPAK